MKKVLVLAVAISLMAAPAFAVVLGSKHDLSNDSTAYAGGASNTSEICVFCHTPHGALDSPLWNRTNPDLSGATAYGNPNGSMNHTVQQALINTSDAPLCLSCHDGTTLLSNVSNPPNTSGTITMNTVGPIQADQSIVDGLASVLDSDFSNDHPIAFVWNATAVSADGELNTQAVIETGFGGKTFLFGSSSNEFWCSSCHDVHAGSSAFLRKSNSNSALCTTCHLK